MPKPTTMFILYVADQRRSAEFYTRALGKQPVLDVPGMTEFALSAGASLGLMPEVGIRRLLGDRMPDPASASGVPRAELYLRVEDADASHQQALQHGATELSPLLDRDWGDRVSYCLDPDGHVVAFAESIPTE